MTNERTQERKIHFLQQGTRALQQGQYAEAIALLEEAYEIDPQDLDVRLNLGGAYIFGKKFKQAITLLEALRDEYPTNPMVWVNLAAAYLGNPILAQDSDQQRAIAAFQQALALDPNAPNVAYNIGLIYRQRQEYPEALHWFQRAATTNPQDRDAHYYIEVISKILADSPSRSS
jgi:protein O-GlcNAc transferase